MATDPRVKPEDDEGRRENAHSFETGFALLRMRAGYSRIVVGPDLTTSCRAGKDPRVKPEDDGSVTLARWRERVAKRSGAGRGLDAVQSAPSPAPEGAPSPP